MATVKALAGETLDELVWRALKKGASAVEQVLQSNPNLADVGLFLPFGFPVVIPDTASAPAIKPMIQLWS